MGWEWDEGGSLDGLIAGTRGRTRARTRSSPGPQRGGQREETLSESRSGRERRDRPNEQWMYGWRGSLRKRDFFFFSSKETWPSADKWCSARGAAGDHRGGGGGNGAVNAGESESVDRRSGGGAVKTTTNNQINRERGEARELGGHPFILQSI